MADRKEPPKSPLARETRGEGAPKRKRNEATVTAEELDEPQRGNERVDGHMIERKRELPGGERTAHAVNPISHQCRTSFEGSDALQSATRHRV